MSIWFLVDLIPRQFGVGLVPRRFGSSSIVHSDGTATTSRRLVPKCSPTLYRVYKVVSAQAVILADPDTGSTNLGFAQPIAVSRLVPFDLMDLEAPISVNPSKIEILLDQTWVKAQIVAQNATGAVRLRLDDPAAGQENELVVHLERHEYRYCY